MVVGPFAGVSISHNSLRHAETHAGLVLAGRAMAGDFKVSPRVRVLPVVMGGGVDSVELGNTVGFEAYFVDDVGSPFTPLDGLAEIKIIDPTGTVKQDWTAMSPRAIGQYLFQYYLVETFPKGTWKVQVRGKLSSGNYIGNSNLFFVTVVA